MSYVTKITEAEITPKPYALSYVEYVSYHKTKSQLKIGLLGVIVNEKCYKSFFSKELTFSSMCQVPQGQFHIVSVYFKMCEPLSKHLGYCGPFLRNLGQLPL